MLKNLNHNAKFVCGACSIGILIAFLFEFIINKIFPQPNFFFSWERFIAMAIGFSSFICLIKYRQYFCKNLHKAFLLISLAFGVSFILVFPKFVYLSPDDQIHFRNAYFFMDEKVELHGGFAAIESSDFTNPSGKGFDELSAVYEYMNAADQVVIDAEYYIDGSPQLYNHIVYLPFYLGFQLSNFLHFNFTTSVVVAKLFNFICYASLIYFAIKLSGRFNKIFFIIGLLTSNMFLATQFSYDPLVVASLLLSISLFLYIRQNEASSTKYLMGFVLAATFGSLTKAVYCPILLLVFMIPNSKFDCKRRAIAFKICATIVMLALASTFILPILSGGLASDLRGGNTSVGAQLSFLINNPIKALYVVITFITSQLPDLVFNPASTFASLGMNATAGYIYNICLPVVSLVGFSSLFILLWVTFRTDLGSAMRTKGVKVGLATIYIILVGATAASMYLSFTPVGSLYVDGLQPRYFMPFLPLLLILFMPSSRSCSKSRGDTATDFCSQVVLFVPYFCLALILSTYILRISIF